MYEIGVAQGRFHVIHKGHIEYLLECKKRCKYLIIGISDTDTERSYFNYDEKIKNFDKNANIPFRSTKNPVFPFTYYERMQMIKLSLIEYNIHPKEFDIVPFPIHKPHLIKYYIPESSVIFITIYDDWGRKKLKLLQNLGFKTEVLWERTMEERFTTGSEIRKRIINNEKWEHLVPKSVFKFIRNNKLDIYLKGVK